MEPRIDHARLIGLEPGSSSARIGLLRLTGALMTLCALIACGEGRQAGFVGYAAALLQRVNPFFGGDWGVGALTPEGDIARTQLH